MFFIIAPPTFISTFRYIDVGTDTVFYLNIYNDNKCFNLLQYLKIYGQPNHTYEIGYQQILWLSYKFNGGYNFVKFLSSLLIVLFSWKGSLYYHRKFKINSGLCMFYLYLMEFSYSLNGVRYSIALSIFFYSFQYVIEKKILNYLFYCAIMLLFHTSLAIALPLYLINFVQTKSKKKIKQTKYFWIIFIITLTVMLRTLISIAIPYLSSVFGKLDNYEIDTSAQFGIGVLMFFLLFLIPLVRWDSFIKKDFAWTGVLIIALLYIPLRSLSYFNLWFNRLLRISEVILCVMYSGIIKLHISAYEKLLWRIYVFLLVFAYYIFSYIFHNYSETYPFIFDFSNVL